MRLLLTTDTIGGVWSFTDTLARGLLAAGHEIAMVSFGRLPSPAQSQTLRELKIEFAQSFYFVSSEAPLEWMADNNRAWNEGSNVLLRIIDCFAPQLLHSSQMCFGRLNSNLPVLVTAHSDVLSWAESTLGPDGVAQLARTASPEWLRIYRSLVQTGLDEAAAVVAPTRWMANTLNRLFDLRRSPGIIWNGAGGLASTSPRKLQAVTAGRLWDQGKGLSVLDQIQMPLPFLIVGEQQPERAQTKGGTRWLGPLAQKDLHALFAQSAIYVATSLYEPFGLAPVEAANYGCAIVARNLPSFREVWGDAALYFESAESIQHILNSLASNPRRLQGAQCRARQRAARYTATAMTEGYLALYEELLAKAVASREPMLAYA